MTAVRGVLPLSSFLTTGTTLDAKSAKAGLECMQVSAAAYIGAHCCVVLCLDQQCKGLQGGNYEQKCTTPTTVGAPDMLALCSASTRQPQASALS